MKKIRYAVKSIRKISTAKTVGELKKKFQENSKNFEIVQQSWFRPLSDNEIRNSPNSGLDYIVSYVSIAVAMYVKAVPHKSISQITLYFSAKQSENIEPKIQIDFDSCSVNIIFDELWKSELNLDRTMKRECTSLADLIWFEYRSAINSEQLIADADVICQHLNNQYLTAKINCIIN